jgi:hypothetical protein
LIEQAAGRHSPGRGSASPVPHQSRGRNPRAAKQADRAQDEARELGAFLERLPDDRQEKFLALCAANLGPLAIPNDARRAIATASSKTLAFARDLAASWTKHQTPNKKQEPQ